ncbi:MAG TPA: Fic family protein [Solirubrobacteraceae bacterium]|nr:Fic family protein [Solirubrobacteraceae bacterium]
MPGAFEVSLEETFELDSLRTAEEIQRCGAEILVWLEQLAGLDDPPQIDVAFVREVHYRWFATTFPADAGRERTGMVRNRKQTAAPVEAILPGIDQACGNWKWRHDNYWPADALEEIRFIVSEANCLAVALYDVHPFVDGNTRTTWHMRNYALMRDGLRPLIDVGNEDVYDAVWVAASALDHRDLDDLVLAELAREDE